MKRDSQSENISFQLDKAALMMDCGCKVSIHAKEGDDPIIWNSTDKTVASVSKDGVVEGISLGDAVITARKKNNVASCRVSVGYAGQNPILPPNWGLFIADGEPHVFHNKMYIYGSRDVVNGYLKNGERNWCSDNHHVIFSDDLIHWNDCGPSVSIHEIPDEIIAGSKRFWAPDVFKSPVEKEKYYMTACTERARCILMESRFPEGPFSNPKLMTIGGEPVKEIDPSVLVDDDGKVYIALPNFYVGQLDPSDYSKIIPETYHSVRDSMPLDNEPFEGPSLKKRMGIYYYIYIQNKGKIETNGAVPVRMAYMTSKNPLGPYTYRGVIIDTYDYPGSGNVHGSFAQFNGNWYLSYHMAVPDLQLTRNACLDKLEFNLDGTIREVLPTSSGAKGGFEVDETIQASSGVIFSGGRNDIRLRTRKEPTENPYVFQITGYPYTVYEKPEEWIGYRYLNFSKRIKNVCVSVKTEAAGAVLEIRKGACDGKLIAKFYLPDTNGSWRTIKNKASSTEDGTDTFFIIMKEKPGKGEVGVDHLIFTVD